MIGWLGRFIVYRVFGSRLLLALAIARFARDWLAKRIRPRGVYQPSQGTSQIEHREPR